MSAVSLADPTSLLLLAGGGLIGALLAVLGAGGSILLLPLLVSGAGLPTNQAVPLSLMVVALLALANVGPYLQRRQLAPRPALLLGLPALAGSWAGGSLVKSGWIPEAAQLTVFIAAALTASWLLTRSPGGAKTTAAAARTGGGRDTVLALQGVLVGLLTGVAGVGGGFAIVPALVLMAGLPMATASGTSLALIALNALVALLALGQWPGPALPLLIPLLLGGAGGALIGQCLAPHLPERRLRQGFSALLVGSALLTGIEVWQRHGRGTPSGQITLEQQATAWTPSGHDRNDVFASLENPHNISSNQGLARTSLPDSVS
ncbi:sulfite exporter TauE/SafE family protein [Synechococcus sp. RSCCF101]|uniref:sulfite exporter TauE/SafE family protein n=1 Tax=Synechococcus sp. RSCCF101 TaxID=2511069 RepID=UPI0012474F2C|nr:sulfite exporter TauE/SafE family protein [Synechococcus sp. RSCCF101]QEY31956.1 sulfite exporter TauE/SafE family protein [Synechococcus sp. RSCCF101]